MPSPIENRKAKIALVTEATGVIGKITAKALLKEGMTVVMEDIAERKLKKLTESMGSRAIPAAFDISNPGAVNDHLALIEQTVGTVDILVNCASIHSGNSFQETDSEEWRRIMDVNLNGMFYMSKAVLPGMKEKGWGRIVNISSPASKKCGIGAGAAFSVSKGGVDSLTLSLAAETAASGITVNAISPVYLNSPENHGRKAAVKKIPLGRFCEPEEFVHTVLFLINPLSGFITGEIIGLNGGLFLF